jgi:hypothetical protein
MFFDLPPEEKYRKFLVFLEIHIDLVEFIGYNTQV